MKPGKLYVVGIGPGDLAHMTPAAMAAVEASTVVVGYTPYLELIESCLEGKILDSTGMKKEIERCQSAIDFAMKGHIVSVISSGDSGVYGMAGLVLELVESLDVAYDMKPEVEIVPGISAVNASAAVLGAPLMHDFAVISLSDLLTEWSVIEKRLDCAGAGDFIVALYNPKSKKRISQIEIAQKTLLKYRSPETPVGIVRNAMRADQHHEVTTLGKMLDHEIDMFTTVIIGNSNTRIQSGRMVTPRGYKV